MNSKFNKGQKITVRPVKAPTQDLRNSALESYAGQIGQVIDFYWISPRAGEVFYIYNVRMESDRKTVVLYEDEMDVYRG